jgi:hypothetical protein
MDRSKDMKVRNVILVASALVLGFVGNAFADEIDDRVTTAFERIDRLVTRECIRPREGERLTSKLNSIKSYIDLRRSRGLSLRSAERQVDELVDRIDRAANNPNSTCNNSK